MAATKQPDTAIPKRQLVKRRTTKLVLDCSYNRLRQLEREGRLRPVRLGARDVHYEWSDIERLVRELREGR